MPLKLSAQKGTALAAGLPLRPEHEMIDEQPALAAEKARNYLHAGRPSNTYSF
jgi:hypothetical protein